jgi:hypothetical protein
MKRILSILCAGLLIIGLAGCGGEKRRVSRELNTLTTVYRKKMERGETKPEQDKAFIKAVNNAVHQLDRNIRGTKAADKTRREAELIGEVGIDPNRPLNLDE